MLQVWDGWIVNVPLRAKDFRLHSNQTEFYHTDSFLCFWKKQNPVWLQSKMKIVITFIFGLFCKRRKMHSPKWIILVEIPLQFWHFWENIFARVKSWLRKTIAIRRTAVFFPAWLAILVNVTIPTGTLNRTDCYPRQNSCINVSIC